jgi:hypothetical protein
MPRRDRTADENELLRLTGVSCQRRRTLFNFNGRPLSQPGHWTLIYPLKKIRLGQYGRRFTDRSSAIHANVPSAICANAVTQKANEQ